MNEMLSLASHLTQIKVSTRNPRHSLSVDIKLWKFKTPLCNHYSPKPEHIPVIHIDTSVKLGSGAENFW